MGDSVKVTLIATGFAAPPRASEYVEEEPAADQTEWLSEAKPEAPAPPAIAPAPAVVETKPPNGAPPPPQVDDLDDLDTPAYLRQRRLLH
jgi:hypothetical protein